MSVFKKVIVPIFLFLLVGAATQLISTEPVSRFTARAGDTMVELFWKKGNSSTKGFLIKRSQTSAPQTPNEGEFVYRGNGKKLIGVNADRGLDNGQTYHYSIFARDSEGNFSTPVSLSVQPVQKNPKKNFVKNSDFSNGLTNWSSAQGASYEVLPCSLPNFDDCLRITPTPTLSGQVTQTLSGLKAETLYTVSVAVRSSSSSLAPTFSVDGPIQQQQDFFCCPLSQGFGPKVDSNISEDTAGYWIEKRFVFWTGTTSDPTNPFNGSVDHSPNSHPYF